MSRSRKKAKKSLVAANEFVGQLEEMRAELEVLSLGESAR